MDLNAEQKRIATQKPKGHMLLKGVAGSGKTSVGIYRVSFLLLDYCLSKDDAILLVTYNRTLARYMIHLYKKMEIIKDSALSALFELSGDRVDIQTVDSLMFLYYRAYAAQKGLTYQVGVPRAVSYEVISEGISKLKKQYPEVTILSQKNMAFLNQEILWIKDCLFLNEEEYQTADRRGMGQSPTDFRPQRLPKNSDTRKVIFKLMQFYEKKLQSKGMISFSDMRLLALEGAKQFKLRQYTHVIVDESQDLTRSQLQFLKYLYNEKDYSSFCFIADAAQNIYPQSWIGSKRSFASIGFNMKGRGNSLSKNYRTCTQISQAAYSLIKNCPDIVENDYFVKLALIDKQGAYPVYKAFSNEKAQAKFLIREVMVLRENYQLKDMAIVARFKRQLEYIAARLKKAGINCICFTDKEPRFDGAGVKLITMHSVKGLEFPVVFIIGLDDGCMPFLTHNDEESRYEESVKERKLLYVGMTRATQVLYLLTSSRPSPFIADISPKYLRINQRSRLKKFYNVAMDRYRFGEFLTDKYSTEEKIRQWMIAELLTNYGFPIDCISVEHPVNCFSKRGYVDIAVHINRQDTTIPFIFIETKRYGHSLQDALNQVKSYMSNCHLCEYGAVTNGSDILVIDKQFRPCADLPVFRSTWGKSATLRYSYLDFKKNLSFVFCFDPNQPDSMEVEINDEMETYSAHELEKLPVYGSILADRPVTMNATLDEQIYLPKKYAKANGSFILKVRGDSMSGAQIAHDDLVVIHGQMWADNLDIAVLAVGEDTTLKRISRMGSNVILLSENPEYDPIMLEEEQVQIIGVAVGVIKPSS